MLPKLDKKSLATYFNDEEVIRDTAYQVEKDFATFGYDIIIPEDLTWVYEKLFDQLLPTIADLLNQQNSRLLAMLYTIDVSEVTIRREASAHPDYPLAKVVTELVLERELKKVVTRHYFRDVGNI